MRAYVGQTRSADLIRVLRTAEIGECTVRGELPPRRFPYFHDNGAYRDWQAVVSTCEATKSSVTPERVHAAFNAVRWTRDLWWMRDHHTYEGHPLPDFVVVPDVPTFAEESLRVSREWMPDVPAKIPVYLAVQDGMEACLSTVTRDAREYDGLFVGGTDDFKERTGARWVQLAHLYGLKCHIGRCGTTDKVRWARDIGADSIDSCLPLMHADHLVAFLSALKE